MIYDGTQAALLSATDKEISDGFIDQSALVERAACEFSREVRKFLNYQAELQRRRLIGPDMLYEALAFVAMIETGFDRKFKTMAEKQEGCTHEQTDPEKN